MAASNRIPVVLRLVASSVCIARRAGKIIRDVMTGGSLGIVEKVFYKTNNYASPPHFPAIAGHR